MNWKKNELEQLLTDEAFQAWLSGYASNQEKKKWEDWLHASPENQKIYEEAQAVWRLAKFKPAPLQDSKKELVKLQQRLKFSLAEKNYGSETRNYHPADRKLPLNRWIFSAAAAVIVLATLTLGIILFLNSASDPEYITVTTRFGEQIRVTLPDHSVVILNGNSKLEYPKNWGLTTNRNVRLSGEAYFEVKSPPKKQEKKFIVDTNDGAITALGTRFVVYERGKGTRVVLEEGRVKVAAKNIIETAAEYVAQMILAPGEMVFFEKGDQKLLSKRIHIGSHVSWWKESFILEETSFKEVAQRLQETYGVIIEVKNEKLFQRILSGSIENSSLGVILDALGKTLQVPVSRQGNTIIFGEVS